MAKKKKRVSDLAFEFESSFVPKLSASEVKRRLANQTEVLEAAAQFLFMEKFMAEGAAVSLAAEGKSAAFELGRLDAVRNLLSEIQHLQLGRLSETAQRFFVEPEIEG